MKKTYVYCLREDLIRNRGYAPDMGRYEIKCESEKDWLAYVKAEAEKGIKISLIKVK